MKDYLVIKYDNQPYGDELKKLYSHDEIQKFVKLGWIESDGAEYDMASFTN